MGSVDPDFKNQTHDFDPGIAPSGLFWTVPVSPGGAQFDLTAGTASLTVPNVPLLDYGTVPNALMHGKFTPATGSLQVTWKASGAPVPMHDDKVGWGGAFMPATATCSWSAQTTGFSYVTDPASTSKTIFATLGREMNGSYYKQAAASPSAPSVPAAPAAPSTPPRTGAGGEAAYVRRLGDG